jgi:farnesyl diphosphate synthase
MAALPDTLVRPPAGVLSWSHWADAVAQTTEATLSRLLPLADTPSPKLMEAMRYSCLSGGKRVRAMLVHAAGEVTGAAPERLTLLAAAVEMIHAYSLIHDDLPCMDDDVLRRGKPTCHVQFDEATALLAGDALQARAFEILGAHPLAEDPARQLAMLVRFAKASGAIGMAGGQAIDLASTGTLLTLEQLEHMHRLKTGALISVAIELGALAGERCSPDTLARLTRYADAIGLAFQVVDDILDEVALTDALGKTAGKDRLQGKSTYVSLLGLTGAHETSTRLLNEAHAAIAPDGEAGLRLRQLADFVVQRSH